MNIQFYKYQGTGNDFIMIDDRTNNFNESDTALVQKLCDRRFGIGADGLILLRLHSKADFEMVYFNADGNPSTMCGNGGRCTVSFAHRLGLFEQETNFMAIDGIHEASIQNDIVTLQMQDVAEVKQAKDHYFLDTGSPHYVALVENIEAFDVYNKGKQIRYSHAFSTIEGTNVNFVEKISSQEIKVRTYERGVEDETFSCGTGVTACALALSLDDSKSPVRIQTKGGLLEVGWKKLGNTYTDIYLKGSAKHVFTGEVEV